MESTTKLDALIAARSLMPKRPEAISKEIPEHHNTRRYPQRAISKPEANLLLAYPCNHRVYNPAEMRGRAKESAAGCGEVSDREAYKGYGKAIRYDVHYYKLDGLLAGGRPARLLECP